MGPQRPPEGGGQRPAERGLGEGAGGQRWGPGAGGGRWIQEQPARAEAGGLVVAGGSVVMTVSLRILVAVFLHLLFPSLQSLSYPSSARELLVLGLHH